MIERIDHLEPVAGERLHHLPLDHVRALHDGRRIDGRRIDVREPREIVERVDEPAHHLALGAPAGLLTLPRRALAKVVVLGGEPEILVPLLVDSPLPIVAGRELGDVAAGVGREAAIALLASRAPARSEPDRSSPLPHALPRAPRSKASSEFGWIGISFLIVH